MDWYSDNDAVPEIIKTFNEATGEWEDNTHVEVAQDIIITDPAKGVVLSSNIF